MRFSSSAAVLALALAHASAAHAYVRTLTGKGAASAWPKTPPPMELGSNLPDGVGPTEAFDAVSKAAAVWGKETNTCTDLVFGAKASADAPAGAGMDARNVVVFFRDVWCNPAELAADGQTCRNPKYTRQALALTTTFVLTTSGKILEADVELNAVDHQWSTGEPKAGHHDIQNALTHEFGHVLGFDHTCALGGEDANLPNDKGSARGGCGNAETGQLEATMFPSSTPGDVDRRSLAPDDVRAVCEVYPKDSGGCAVGGGRPSGFVLLSLLGAVALLRRARALS